MNLNKVFLIGRLTRDPESKTLPSGTAVAAFGLATDRYFTDKSGQKQQQTDFHNIVLFGRLAEIASQYSTKGSLVFIEGRIRTSSWQDASGNKRYKTEIIGEKIQLGPKSAGKTIPQEKETPPQEEIPSKEQIPIIEEEGDINVKDIPF
ncbi:single-stranded DNA-binding protein [Patescibacteria group bacterium]|nr:single-stranded DNA-binding protein [Patescibacteria group bacterium]MBU4480919.1 single-stranded DNA-binding protein [Patescibacteria group bacterium]